MIRWDSLPEPVAEVSVTGNLKGLFAPQLCPRSEIRDPLQMIAVAFLLGPPATRFWIVFITNAMTFIDGLLGPAGGVALTAS